MFSLLLKDLISDFISVFGEHSFCRETRSKRLRGRHVAYRSSVPQVAYPEVKVRVRDLVRVGYCCPFCPTGVQYSGNIRFIEPQGIKRHRRPVPGAPSSGTPWESVWSAKGAKSTGTGVPLNFYRCTANFYRSTAKFDRSTAYFTGPPLFFYRCTTKCYRCN